MDTYLGPSGCDLVRKDVGVRNEVGSSEYALDGRIWGRGMGANHLIAELYSLAQHGHGCAAIVLLLQQLYDSLDGTCSTSELSMTTFSHTKRGAAKVSGLAGCQ